VDEDRAVLGRRDVPLQTLEDDQIVERRASRHNVGVHLAHADPGVRHTAVIGDDDPVQPVRTCVARLIDDPIHPVGAVEGVDVMVAGQPPQPADVAQFVVVGSGGLRGREHGCHRGTGPDESGSAQQTATAQLGGRQLGVRNREIHLG
jgi:hypothetical protein